MKEDEKKMYKLFNFEPKFIKLLENNEVTLDNIEKHITEKMKSQYTNLGISKDLYIFNIYSKVGNNIKYDILPLKTISLKYCKLILEKETFYLEYKFPFFQYIIEKLIKEIDTKIFFEKNKYQDSELYNYLKGYFFKYASINEIENIKDTFFDTKIKYILIVESIVKMEESNSGFLKTTVETFNNQKIFSKIKKEELLNKYLNKVNSELENMKNSKLDNKNIEYYFYNSLKKEKEKIENIFLGKKTKLEKDKEESTKIINKNKTKDISKEIKINKTKKEINLEEIIDEVSYSEDFKNSGILIKQKQLNGKTLDLGVLIGDKNNKSFIGFQIKFFGPEAHSKNFITKKSIKEEIQPILIKCFQKYDLKITNWHYIMCLYFNSTDLIQYNQQLINLCNSSDIQYIFYNPIEKKFYNKQKKPLLKLNLDYKTNIDFE